MLIRTVSLPLSPHLYLSLSLSLSLDEHPACIVQLHRGIVIYVLPLLCISRETIALRDLFMRSYHYLHHLTLHLCPCNLIPTQELQRVLAATWLRTMGTTMPSPLLLPS